MAHGAAAHGVAVAPHWNADIHVHLPAIATNCPTVEYFGPGEEDVYNFDLVLREHLSVNQGVIEVADRPGVGLVLDERAVQRFSIT